MTIPTPLGRRAFLTRLGAVTLLGTLPLPRRTPVVLLRTSVAGAQFRIEPEDLADLRVGDVVALVREPRNRFDPSAVRIDAPIGPIGYLPRRLNTEVARRLDRGEELEARLVEVHRDRPMWEAVVVEVRGARS